MRTAICLVLAACCGCGSTGDSGGGASHLPVSGAGPFQPLSPADNLSFNAPFILQDNLADLDDADVLVAGDAIGLWVTARRTIGTRIEHADALTLEQGFLGLSLALEADQPWEGGAVVGPSVLWESPWIMFYGTASGAIGWATAADGHTWIKAPGPALVADTLEEGNALEAPAAVRIDDRLRVYYPAGGRIWAADAPFADVAAGRPTTWSRLDGDPRTPERDPFVSGARFAQSLGGVTARAAQTPAGRIRHDLYFTGVEPPTTGSMPTTPTNCGFAASFSGVQFAVADTPILPPMVVARGCAETPYRGGALLFYIVHNGVRDVLAVAHSP
jgi:hypothetical protein